MYINDYISKDYPCLDVNISVTEAREILKDFGYTHIFITKNGSFIGALSKAFLEDYKDANLKDVYAHFEKFAIVSDANMVDSIKLFYTYSTNVLPVIDRNENYLGYISCDDVFNEFSKYPMFSENAAALTIQTKAKFYSMTEIAHIVESNNAKIYGFFISKINDDNFEISLKISQDNLSSIDETFERYGYNIVSKFYNDEKEELIKNRFDFLQKYLEF